jgi:hypothetical protein
MEVVGQASSGAEGVEKQVRRLLGDARTRVGVREFFGQWLRFDMMKVLQKDLTMFPGFGAETTQAMRDSADKFIETVFFEQGSFKTLLTDNHAWVNDTLSTIYGVPAPGSNELKLVQVDATQRAGIMTNAGLMAAFAHTSTDAPVLRGVFVLDRLLCSAPSGKAKLSGLVFPRDWVSTIVRRHCSPKYCSICARGYRLLKCAAMWSTSSIATTPVGW